MRTIIDEERHETTFPNVMADLPVSQAVQTENQSVKAKIERVSRRRRGEEVEEASPWKRRIMVLGLAGAAATLAAVVLFGMQEGAVYAKPVDELVKDPTRFAGRSVRAEGMLVSGTLKRQDSPCEFRFEIEKNGKKIPVRYAKCTVPDTFRDVPGMDVAVTVEGELKRDGNFEASNVLAKCPSKYEMQEKQKKGEQMPHGELSKN